MTKKATLPPATRRLPPGPGRPSKQDAAFVHLDDRFDLLFKYLRHHFTRLDAQIGILMTTLTDVQAKIASLTAAVAANTAIDGSIVTLLQGLTAMIAALKQQLADAIASNDPVALQAALDALSALETTVAANTQKLADAATANTPA